MFGDVVIMVLVQLVPKRNAGSTTASITNNGCMHMYRKRIGQQQTQLVVINMCWYILRAAYKRLLAATY